jgi:hypothetical protein
VHSLKLLTSRVFDDDSEPFIFARDNLPQPQSTLRSDEIWMRRLGFHFYDGFPVDSIDLCADQKNCTCGTVVTSD